jgi:catechol 2,3-dioxygenase-like lactoylglutathione lyase family enzyme
MKLSTGTLSFVAPVFRVTALDRTIAFYRERLGFELEFCYEGFYASVCRSGCHVHLQCAPPNPRDQSAFERNEHIDACFVVQDIGALWDSMASAGITFTVPLRNMPYGQGFYVRDPDGYILGFVEPAEGQSEPHTQPMPGRI